MEGYLIISENKEISKDKYEKILSGNKYEVVTSKNFDGLSDLVQIILGLSSLSIPAITKIIIEVIKAKSAKSVKINDMEFIGLSENEIIELLRKSEINEAKSKDIS